MEIISLDPGRIEILKNSVIKKSSIEEFENLNFAQECIKNFPNIKILNKEYKIKSPKTFYFKDNKIYMERCFGDNLELMLRNNETHKLGVNFLNNLLVFFINNEFGWKDFAPRNILIGKNDISIMDFERGIINPLDNIKEYLIDSVYEEYGAFLLPSERIYDANDIFTTSDNSSILFDEIKSNRVKTILNIMGYSDKVPTSKYILAVKMIVFNETPYIENNNINYPLIDLEDYMKINGYKKYAKKIIGGYYEKK